MSAERKTPRAPGGKRWEERMRAELRRASGEALGVLEGIMHGEDVKEADRIRAAEAILDRGYGKSAPAAPASDAPQIIFLGGDGLGD